MFVQAAWLLAPGLLAAAWLRRRDVVASHLVTPLAVLVGCLVGYGALWVYLLSRPAGAVYGFGTIGLSVACLAVLALRAELRRELTVVNVLVPLALMIVATLFYASLTFSCSVDRPVVDTNQFCHIYGLTGDNVLPLIFADNVHHGDPRALTWNWQGSDRPPLQSGVVLAQSALIQATGWRITGYLALAMLLQAAWLPALWAICRSLKLSGARLAVVLALCAGSGFFLFNSVFTWPKLLAAALVLTAFCLWFDRRPGTGPDTGSGTRPGTWTYGLAGCAAGAGMVAHTGVAFTLLPIGVVLLLPRYRPGLKPLLITGLTGLVMLAPWTAYQKVYDPPGDKLLRLHIGGAVDERSFGRTLFDSYTNTPPSRIAGNKLDNATTLFGYPNPDGGKLLGRGRTATVRVQEFVFVLFALGLFNIGWIVLAVPALRRRARQVLDPARLTLMLAVSGGSLLLWVLVMWGPPYATPVVFQGSYATMMLLFAALGAMVVTLPKRVVGAIGALQLGYFALIWVVTAWRGGGYTLYPSHIALTVVSAALVAVGLVLTARLTRPAAAIRGEDHPGDGTDEAPVGSSVSPSVPTPAS